MDSDALDLSILAPAFVTGLLVLATHVPLGREVIRKGIIFIDLAIAQVGALGVLIALAFGFDNHGWQMQLIAIGSAITAALVLYWSETRWPRLQEAIIGVSFVVAASVALLVVSKHPHGSEHLGDVLAGQILWTGWSEIALLAVVTAVLLAVWSSGKLRQNRLGFYLLFAVAVTCSVQLVGVYLVFASLIIPALAVLTLAGYRAHIVAWSLGAIGYALGLLASAWFDLPSGPAIVCLLTVVALLSCFVVGKN